MSPIFVIFLLVLSICNCVGIQLASSKQRPFKLAPYNILCNRLLPGLSKLRLGVDVTRLDLFPPKYDGDDGFKNPIIDFNCSKGKLHYIGKDWYDVPDEVSSVMNTPGGNVEVNILKTSSDVLNMMGAHIGLNIEGFFSASLSYKRMAGTFLNESRYIERILSLQSTSRADLLSKYSLKLGKYAQQFIDSQLPSEFESNPEKYFEFIRSYGTHYFSNIKLGGCLQLYLETLKSYYQTRTEHEVKAEAGATFALLMRRLGGTSGSKEKVDTHFTSSTNEYIRYYGGDTNLLKPGGIASWQPSVAQNPSVLGGHLVPISDLILDKSKRKSMEKAVQIYIDYAYLDSLADTLNWSVRKYSVSRERIENYLKKVKALKKANSIDHKELVDIGDNIERELQIPPWFHKQVQLCYKWRPDGDSGQCGGGVRRHLCARVGTMTEYYRDNTDDRVGGCRMQWGIVNSGSEPKSLLSKIRICYRWRPEGNDNQCGGGGGGVDRQSCASINRYTPEYRDNTDHRSWGCLMQWALMVPDDAPIWLQNMQLCFQWHPDGDPEQCGGGVGRLLCATTNNWTTLYRDDTDRKEGGCRMRWGIVLNNSTINIQRQDFSKNSGVRLLTSDRSMLILLLSTFLLWYILDLVT